MNALLFVRHLFAIIKRDKKFQVVLDCKKTNVILEVIGVAFISEEVNINKTEKTFKEVGIKFVQTKFFNSFVCDLMGSNNKEK